MTSSASGPWICIGATSISSISTSNSMPTLTPCSHCISVESEIENQNSSSSGRSSTGSFSTPPSSLQRMTYFPSIASIVLTSRVTT